MTYNEVLEIATGWEKLMTKMDDVLSAMEKATGGLYTFENITLIDGVPTVSILYDNEHGSGIAHVPLTRSLEGTLLRLM